jgi:hypothetical protein
MNGHLRDVIGEPVETLRGIGGILMARGDGWQVPAEFQPYSPGAPKIEEPALRDPSLYQFLTSEWPMTYMDQPAWQAAVREACAYRERWLEHLIETVGVAALTEVFEQIMLSWKAMKEALDHAAVQGREDQTDVDD